MTKLGENQNITFAADAFKVPLAAFRGDGPAPGGTTHPAGFDLIMKALGHGEPDMGNWFPELEKDNDTYGCTAVKDPRTLTTLYRGFDAYKNVVGDSDRTAAERATLERDTKALLASFKKGPSGHFIEYLSCHWDNNDDTSADALIRIDNDADEMRVLVGFNGA